MQQGEGNRRKKAREREPKVTLLDVVRSYAPERAEDLDLEQLLQEREEYLAKRR